MCVGVYGAEGRPVLERVVFQHAHKGSQEAGVNLGAFGWLGDGGRRKVVFKLSLGLRGKFVSEKLVGAPQVDPAPGACSFPVN